MNNWKKFLPMSLGIFLSLACVLFLMEAIREIDFDGWDYNLPPLLYFVFALICGLIGIPLVLSQIDKHTKDSS